MYYYMVALEKKLKIYLYKSRKGYYEGYSVTVSICDEEMQGLIVSIHKTNPLIGEVLEKNIPDIINRNRQKIGEETIKKYLLFLIDGFKEGFITKESFAIITEGFVSNNELRYQADSPLGQLLDSDIPDTCLFYVDEPGNEEDKEFEFQKAVKEWERVLRYNDSDKEKG